MPLKSYRASSTSIITKIDRLFDLLKDGNRRLIQNRKKTLATFEKQIAEYKAQPVHAIDQTTLGFDDESD